VNSPGSFDGTAHACQLRINSKNEFGKLIQSGSRNKLRLHFFAEFSSYPLQEIEVMPAHSVSSACIPILKCQNNIGCFL